VKEARVRDDLRSKALVATAATLIMLTGCGSPQQPRGVGSLGLVSGAPSLGPAPSLPPSGGPSTTPSSGGPGNGNGGGGHGGMPPKPPPKPPPVQPGDHDYIAVIAPIDSAPECFWSINSAGPMYFVKVLVQYVGPPLRDTSVKFKVTVTDIQGTATQTGNVEVNATKPTPLYIQEKGPVPTAEQIEYLDFTVDGGPDANPGNDTASLDIVVPFNTPPSPGARLPVNCVRVPR
jgi:hypothetical protein